METKYKLGCVPNIGGDNVKIVFVNARIIVHKILYHVQSIILLCKIAFALTKSVLTLLFPV